MCIRDRLASIAVMIFGIAQELVVPIVAAVVVFCLVCLLFAGLRVINPNEALVLTLFGKYYGTIKSHGFFFINPFATGRDVYKRQIQDRPCPL